jgi:hypothetical protein
MIRLTVLSIGLLVAACRGDRSTANATHSTATMELDALDSLQMTMLPEIIRLSEQSMGGLSPASAYCLATSAPTQLHPRGTPPTKALLTKLAGHQPPIFSVADCVGQPGASLAPIVGGRAWFVWEIARVGHPGRAEVTGGYYAGPLLAAEWVCSVREEFGKWILTAPCHMKWIS